MVLNKFNLTINTSQLALRLSTCTLGNRLSVISASSINTQAPQNLTSPRTRFPSTPDTSDADEIDEFNAGKILKISASEKGVPMFIIRSD